MKKLSARLRRLFYEPGSRGFAIVNDFLAVLTIVSVLAIILETVPELAAYIPLFNWIEYITVFFFTLEYLARIFAERRDFGAYVFSFFGIIDLLAIVPTYVGVANLTFLKTARVLRILRLLRMVRLAKMTRLMDGRRRDLEGYQAMYRFNLGIYFFALFAATVLFGTMIYVSEGHEATFASIPLGMLWAMKPLLGGIAQAEPATWHGEVISILARFTGLALFGLLLAIIGSGVKKLLFGSTEIE